jgi:hypothetical protein
MNGTSKASHHLLDSPRGSCRPICSTLLALSVFGSTLLIRHYNYLASNQALQIPFVQIVRDPSLYPADPFAKTLTNYCSLFWIAVAHMRIVPLPALLLILYLAITAGGLWAAALIAKGFFPESRLGPWTAAILFGLGIEPILGGAKIVLSYTEHTSASVVFFLLAFYSALVNKPYWWAISFALGFSCNPMYGTHALLYFLIFALLLLPMRQFDRRWIYACVLLLALTLPGMVWCIKTVGALHSSSHALNEAWYQAARARLSHHLFPLTWSIPRFLEHAALAVLVVVLARSEPREGNRGKLLIYASAGASTIWLALSFVAAYVIKTPAALSLHPGRGVDLFYALSALYIVSFFSFRYEASQGRQQEPLLYLLGLLGAILFWKSLPMTVVAVLLILPSVRFAWPSILDESSHLGLRAIMCVSLLGTALLVTANRIENKHYIFYKVRPSVYIRDAAQWAAANTDKNAAFLVDPFGDDDCFFRPLSKRPTFVTWKDGSALVWSAKYATEFVGRLNALGIRTRSSGSSSQTQAAFARAYASLTDQQIQRIAHKYRLKYAVFVSNRKTDLPIVYRNSRYKLAQLSSR